MLSLAVVLPVESLETTLPSYMTVWSYFFVESLYLSISRRSVLRTDHGRLDKRWACDLQCIVTFEPGLAEMAVPISWLAVARTSASRNVALMIRDTQHTLEGACNNAPLARRFSASSATVRDRNGQRLNQVTTTGAHARP